ncbi:uncharacterized protein [Coffea arabica]|uniref:Uncharacterized protein isoform X2 n=1 Tax=Coffea arabica TaxID=13443 RepID=A0ABM4X093_COFAR
MEENSKDKVDIKMYFGGKFKEKPRLHYTGTHMAIFKERVEDKVDIVSLCRMFKKVDEGATRVTFWFCAPFVDLDGGLHPIRNNDDIKLMNLAYEGTPERLIYACSGDEPFEKEPEDGGVNDGISTKETSSNTTIKKKGSDTKDGGVAIVTTGTDTSTDDNEEPEWLKEGLETIEDEDIFAPKKDAAGDNNQTNITSGGNNQKADGDKDKADGATVSARLPLHVFSFAENKDEKSAAKSADARKKKTSKTKQSKGPDVIQKIPPTISTQIPSQILSEDEAVRTEKDPSTVGDPDLRAGIQQEVNDDVVEENWQEPVISDEELLDAKRCDGREDDDCLDFNPEVEFKKPNFELKVGQKFTNFRVFRFVLREWLVREGYEVTWVKNYSKKIIAKCAKGCTWRIRATPIQFESTFQIKSLKGEHVCAREYQNKHATAAYLSIKYQDKIRDNPRGALMGLKNDIRRDLMINVSIAKVGRAKRKAKDLMLGTDMEQYQKLWSYAATVRDTNPGSTIKIQMDRPTEGSNGTFERLYYCLHACKQGFLDGCRPIIGLDGCFLKTAFGGQLLSALGRDGNDNMVPIAVAVVEVERYDS